MMSMLSFRLPSWMLGVVDTSGAWEGWEHLSRPKVVDTLPETNSSHLKIDLWNLGDSYWKPPFSGAMFVSFREGIFLATLESCQFFRVRQKSKVHLGLRVDFRVDPLQVQDY